MGCNWELQECYALWTKGSQTWSTEWPQIHWRFAPPYSPRWTGHVEIMVQIFKTTMKQLMASIILNLRSEEFTTLCVEASGMMNRRTLVQLRETGEIDTLALVHFLLAGNPYLGLGPYLAEGSSLSKRYQELSSLTRTLWSRLQKGIRSNPTKIPR